MNTLTIILSIIIILLIIYLYLNYYKYKKSIESFDIPNSYYNTQTSLSTYFQNNVDNDIKHNKNIYNNPIIKPNIKYAGWNGLWMSKDDPNFNSAFLQNNDKLLISFSNTSLDQVYVNMLNDNFENSSNSNNCSNNLFLGIGQLNNERNSFNLIKIICNTYINNSLTLRVNGLSGTLSHDKNNIDLFSTGIFRKMTLNKYNYYDFSENTNVDGSNIINGSIINNDPDYCKNVCNDDNNCIGFSYNKSNNTCYLKNGTSNTVTDNNYISYFKSKDLLNSLPNYGDFLNSISPFVNNYQSIPLSNFSFNKLYCQDGTTPCYNNNSGITYTTYNGINYNACGSTVSDSDNTCATTSCLINNSNIANIPRCNINIKLNDYMNHHVFSEISQKTGSTLNICSHIQTIKKCNSYIICYISNVGNVYTLNYQFIGILPQQNNLTVQVDIMNEKLNNTQNSLVSLPFYRYVINNYNKPSNNFTVNNKLNALSFTNCFENNKNNEANDVKISSSMSNAKKYVSDYIPINGNNNLKPALWSINYKKDVNLVNSCSIILSTSEKYDSPVKYVNFDNENVNLSLYSGGSNQEFIMENTRVIHEIDFENTSFVAMTTNLRANNQLYLIPNTSNGGFSNNSNIVSLTNSPEENGKWLLIGFNIDKITNLMDIINNIKFYIDNNE